VVYDTGSSNYWVPDKNCTLDTKISPACATDNKFDSSKSSTYQRDGRDYFLPYGSGVAAGFLGRDDVQVGSVSLSNYTFGQTTVLPGDDFDPPFNGIAGLAYPIIALPIGSFLPTVLDAMINASAIPEPIVHVYLSSANNSNSSFFSFGAVDESVVDGPFTTVPFSLVQPVFGYWMGDITSLEVPSINKTIDVQFWGVWGELSLQLCKGAMRHFTMLTSSALSLSLSLPICPSPVCSDTGTSIIVS
jgi:hypothetical protein